MSQKSSDSGSVQHPAEVLLRSTRDAYSPTDANRERVRRALAKRLAQSTDVPAPDMTALTRAAKISPWVKPVLGVVLATGATFAILRYSDSREPAAKPLPEAASTEIRVPLPSSERGSLPATPTTATLPSSASALSSSALPTRDRVPLAAGARPARQSATRDASSRRLGKTQNAAPAHNPDRLAPIETDNHTAAGDDPVRDGEHRDPQIASDNGPQVLRSVDPAATPAQSEHDKRVQAQAWNAQNPSQKRAPAEEAENHAHRAEPLRDQVTLAARPQSPLSAAATSSTARPAKSTPASTELAFVKRILAALHAGEPQHVLELCQEHERRWPQGTFVQEREGLRTIAACEAHTPNALSGANEFSAAYPRSPMLSRVHSACTPPSAAKSAH